MAPAHCFLERATIGLLALAVLCPRSCGAEAPAAARFRQGVAPILADHCYDCHGGGTAKGGLALDHFDSDAALLGNRDLWVKVLKYVRAGIMPPAKRERPSDEERGILERWIKYDALGIDPQDPDPGRVTLRRLNRVEYRNTIRDLMGIDFRAEEDFPADDTGYGFDNIGDVLTVSPLLLEKYMQAAETVVAAAVPTTTKVVPESRLSGNEFRGHGGAGAGEQLSFYQEAQVSRPVRVQQAGDYHLIVDLNVRGDFGFDPGRCRLVFKAGGRELLNREFAWEENRAFHFTFDDKWQAGEQRLTFELHPLAPPEQKRTSVDLRVLAVTVQGPLDRAYWHHPKNYDRFYFQDEPPAAGPGRRPYAREVLRRFATRAFRRPVDDRTLDRLVAMAEEGYGRPDQSFEEGVAGAMVAVLASPRFLFRVEEADPADVGKAHPFVDEYALASRLSYFLWSTMPDEELFRLAGRGELRKDLAAQVRRMLNDSRSDELMRNFTGQWLQVRDVEGVPVNARMVMARDAGREKELKRQLEAFRARLANPGARLDPKEIERLRSLFKPKVDLDGEVRRAMRRETEMSFAHVVRENQSVLDLIDCDYTFLNERLAGYYGIPGVSGKEMRRVTLPKDSPRGGVLTQGAVLAVTSNPTRTSPVKRGQFILDNILGMPAPPPPPEIPALEEAEKQFTGREPTMRETLALHRNAALCSSCHSRMDPLGLALDNFNAMGLWRDSERGQPIDASGRLITGESFHDVRDLKHILKDKHRLDFYRCLTEKLLTYALGRGLEDYDVHTVDQIVERLDREQGHFSALLTGVIESAPFQKRRNGPAPAAGQPAGPSERRVQPEGRS